jgi:predicted ABC-type ATPase
MRKIIAVAGPVYSGKTTFIQNNLSDEYPDAVVCDFSTISRKYRLNKLPYGQIFEDDNKVGFLMNKFTAQFERLLFVEQDDKPLILELPVFSQTQPLIQELVILLKEAGFYVKWIQLTVDSEKQQEIKLKAEADKNHRSSYFGAEDYLEVISEVITSNKLRLKEMNKIIC